MLQLNAFALEEGKEEEEITFALNFFFSPFFQVSASAIASGICIVFIHSFFQSFLLYSRKLLVQ